MGVGIQNETKKLFRQEENHTEYDLIPFFNTNAGRNLVEDSEEELLSEIETYPEEEMLSEIETYPEEGLLSEIETDSEEGLLSDDYFLDEDPFYSIDADVLDAAIRNHDEY